MSMNKYLTWIVVLVLLPGLSFAAGPRLVLPDFTGLAGKASDSVTITLDASMLSLAARFLDPSDPDQAAAEDAIKGLQGIVVRSYTFDQDGAYKSSDLDGVRSQLAAPGWNRLMETRSQKSHANVEIYLMTDANKAVGLAVIASEPRQLTIVNIIGAIDLQKLHKLEGRFGVPKLDLDATKAPATNGAPRVPTSH
jgi:Domain of unknown function (DUF4252)